MKEYIMWGVGVIVAASIVGSLIISDTNPDSLKVLMKDVFTHHYENVQQGP